jgi:L-fuconolactonase
VLIDAHQHFWTLARGDYAWLTPELRPLYRDYASQDLRPLLTALRIGGTVLVQAAPTLAETSYLLLLADDEPFIRAVVGWIDFESEHAVASLHAFAQHSRFRGVRPMLQDIDDPEWILSPEFDLVFRCLIERDLCFDALVRPHQLHVVRKLMTRHPDLRLVIDHGAKPPIASDAWEPWASDIADLASATGAFCKLSGLLTEAGPAGSGGSPARYAAHLLDTFGPQRLMWGSDWPVLLLAGTYERWFDTAREFVEPWGDGALQQVFGGTATRFYRLQGPGEST